MILVTGASGFVGRNVIRQTRAEERAVRALVRSPEKAKTLTAMGVEVFKGDVTDKASLEKAFAGAEALINLVGIIKEKGKDQTFKKVHLEGTQNLVEVAKKAGIKKIVHNSVIGAGSHPESRYFTTKREAERIIEESGIPYTIFRCSYIYGSDDLIFNTLVKIIRRLPLFPIIGSGEYKLQPIFVGDLITCFFRSLTKDDSSGKIYQAGGPEVLTYNEAVDLLMEQIKVKKPQAHLPVFLATLGIKLGEHLFSNPLISSASIYALLQDYTCDVTPLKEDFDIEPISFKEGLKKCFPN